MGGKTASPASNSATAESGQGETYVWIVSSGGQKPWAAIPNPGTGRGNPVLARALLPQSSSAGWVALLVPPGVVALPQRDPNSLFIGLRENSSPVSGPRACDGWAGLWYLVTGSFNRPGVQVAVEQNVVTPAGRAGLRGHRHRHVPGLAVG